MKKFFIGAVLLTSGCATDLNSFQKAELKAYESRGMAVQEKNPGTAAALGLLPGGGSFYSREYGFGVVNLLFWPLSILWDPVNGYDSAQTINYNATKAHVAKLRDRELDELDEKLASAQIDLTKYTLEKRKISDKYSADF